MNRFAAAGLDADGLFSVSRPYDTEQAAVICDGNRFACASQALYLQRFTQQEPQRDRFHDCQILMPGGTEVNSRFKAQRGS